MTKQAREKRLTAEKELEFESELEYFLSRRLVHSVLARYMMGCLQAYRLWITQSNVVE